MATVKSFNCETCSSEGKISIKGDELTLSDIVYCPVCGGNIYDEEIDGDDD